jgi:hypothetical protein
MEFSQNARHNGVVQQGSDTNIKILSYSINVSHKCSIDSPLRFHTTGIVYRPTVCYSLSLRRLLMITSDERCIVPSPPSDAEYLALLVHP